MECVQWQEAISARADGEDPGVDEPLLDAHLARCPSCRVFAASVEGSRRRLSLHVAAPMPDLSRRVAKANALFDRAGKWSIVRAMLVVVAAEIAITAAPALLLGEGETDAHDARHLGAFSIAYAVALLVAAVRPARARTVLPVAAMLAGALMVTAISDIASGTIPLITEASHLPELISVVLVWLLSMPARHDPAHAHGEGRTLLRLAQRAADEGRGREAV